MAIKRDMSEVPPAAKQAGYPPLKKPEYAALLARKWADAKMDRDELEFSIPDTRIRMSWAADCARKMSYGINGTEPTEPFDEATFWNFGIGSWIHEEWQRVLTETFPGAEAEVTTDLRPFGLDGSGHCDLLLVTEDGRRIAFELKSIGGFGAKMAVGARGPARGPSLSHITQGALNGLALDADEVRIIYLSKENMSDREMTNVGFTESWQKFCYEWVYSREEYEAIAHTEIKRMNKILDYVDNGELAPRQIPDKDIPPKARIVDPSTGRWELQQDGMVLDSGSHWLCAYCPYQSQCISDGPTLEDES